MRFAYEHFKIVTEPGAVVAVVGLAAILNGQVPIKDKLTVATVITGGNIASEAVRRAWFTSDLGIRMTLRAD